jgi:hypothetical protein
MTTPRPLPASWIPPDVHPHPDWMTRARCLDGDHHPDAWFPEGMGQPPASSRAIEACGGCDVRLKCLQYALDIEGSLGEQSRFGIWGGLTPGQRAKLASRRGRRAA